MSVQDRKAWLAALDQIEAELLPPSPTTISSE
jgi:hypothetical protein